MTASVSFGRNDGGYDVVTTAVTTQASAGLLTGGINRYVSAAGATAVILPANYAANSPVVVFNATATATAGVIFPPVGGSINGAAANASIALPASKGAVCYAHPNGLDYTVVVSA